uniref:Uncharacterized protein n=1 Tax=Meloidogyne enterolobii TaxID=390850 RepID=A0A6V7X4W0_MELEN|nr:unnamed protein product [Meloidogyne enterolobii]
MMESTPYYKEKACQLLCLFFLSIRSFNPYLTTKCPYNSSIYPINFLYYSFLVVVTIAPYNNTRNNNIICSRNNNLRNIWSYAYHSY